MNTHPSQVIAAETVRVLRESAGDAEKAGRLTERQLDLVYQHNWFNLFVPEQYGGLELDLSRALSIEEALAWTDGSLGWTVTLCSGANFFIGFLQPDAIREIFTTPKVCLSGSGHPTGKAILHEQGYAISGHWKYATGSPQATVFTAACMIEKDGNLLTNKEGQPAAEAFWFHREEVVLHEDWQAMGMIATASNSFEVKDLKVPAYRRFILDPAQAVLPQPVFRYPFLQFAEATLAVNCSGMAMRFLDLFLELGGSMETEKKIAAKQGALIDSARTAFYGSIADSWSALTDHHSIDPEKLNNVSKCSRRLAKVAIELVQMLFPHCGMRAVDPATEINRCWRNIHTASLHKLVRDPL